MTRKNTSYICGSDLRDQATSERVDRIWAAIDADLALDGVRQGAEPKRVWLWGMGSAAVASLALGLVIGKLVWDVPQSVEMSAMPVASVSSSMSEPLQSTIWAAGTEGRAYMLPGGAELRLSPGSMVELVHDGGQQGGDNGVGGVLQLRLVQGEVTVDTDTAQVKQGKNVELAAGEAVFSTEGAGVMHVRRSSEQVDVTVTKGRVKVSGPEGEQRVRAGESLVAMALRRGKTVSRVVGTASSAGIVPEKTVAAVSTAADVVVSKSVLLDWQARSRLGDSREAYRLLSAQPGGIDAAIQGARDADMLWEIHDVAIGQDPAAAYRALIRVADGFPGDASAQLAAYKLGNYYRKAGMHEQASKWFARTAESSEGMLAEDALCKQFRTSPDQQEARGLAREYLNRYPDGRCKVEAQQLVDSSAVEAADDDDPSVSAADDDGVENQTPLP